MLFKKKYVIAALALLVAAGVGTALALSQTGAKKDAKKNEEKVFEFAAGDLAEMQRVPLGRQIPVSGSVKPLLQATVRSKVPAEVAKIHVQEGQRVDAGTALVTLDTADLKARYDAQAATVAEAKARLDLARKNLANNKQLLEKTFISQNAYDTVSNTVLVAEAILLSAEAQATIAQRALNDASIRAPFNGVVAKRWVNVGDKVTADMPVAYVVDLGRMELEAAVPVGEIPFVHVGQEILFTVDGFPTRKFSGKVERVNPSAEAGSRTIMVFVTLPNADSSLKGGMFANGILATGAGTDVNVIPITAILEEGGQTFVHVVKGGKIERRSVVTGPRSVERGVIVVKEGLEPNVPVVIVKADGIKAGATAIVKGAAGAPPAAAAAPKAS
ncbi:Multidrug resistance protein MdtA [Usitatibacter rugosus]|uniref:Multidrug resistance protein MdtA n=1 Tax=Usitatibacter rugosus TaxID=2732067 RepID=A0A6M4GYK6_9PROT|nr:efflux RND transporter periplasmic adaptor subunit [Usitatibacter rugosus]QJR12349.1 Multidrug resistance protein MdtA [Usitatibacter rugosus]